MPPLTVTQFVEAINLTLESLEDVTVEGEVDEFKIIHQKWVTFQIKDKQSSVGCFMTVWQYKTQIEDGMLVRATGRPNLRQKGFFSFVLARVEPAGEGALKRAFELLKQKLTSEGLFAPERKRALPRFPAHLAFITSRDAAAYNDFLKVLAARQGGLRISFFHTQVQGADAPRQIIAAIDAANTTLEDADVIILVRGGGSLEDLQAFNDESVVRAVAASRTPTIVGVGHERDTTLAELAADLRASTPSNAAELVVRSRQELVLAVQQLERSLARRLNESLQQHLAFITRSVRVLRAQMALPQQKIQQQGARLAAVQQRLRHAMQQRRESLAARQVSLSHAVTAHLKERQQSLRELTRTLATLSPRRTLQRGYSITRTAQGRIVRSASDLKLGQPLTTELSHGSVHSTVTGADTQRNFAF